MVRMTPELLAKVDADRGDLDRSAWIRSLAAGSIEPSWMDQENVVYRLWGEEGDLLYVGVTAHLRERMWSHQAHKPWWDEVAAITVERHESRQDAERAEAKAILEEVPGKNRNGGSGRRPINLRFETALLVEVDRAARAAGITRTEFMEQACRHAVDEMELVGRVVRSGPARQAVVGARQSGKATAAAKAYAETPRPRASKAAERPHSVVTANRSAAGSKPLERREAGPKPGDCPHPVSRRIGDQCGACGSALPKGKR